MTVRVYDRLRHGSENLMKGSVLLFLAAASGWLPQEKALAPPKRPAEPFRIRVFAEPKGEPAAVERVLDAERECHKIVNRRKDWFVAASDVETAEIVMEIKASWVEERMSATSSPMSRTRINVVQEHHHLFAEVTVLGGQFGLRADDRRSLKGAASKLIDALQEFCKKNYWEILERR
jgi:hypothetical protein